MSYEKLEFWVPEELKSTVIGVVSSIVRIKKIYSTTGYDADNDVELMKEEESVKEEEFTPPSLNEVRAFIRERNSPVDPDRFYNWHKNRNWRDKANNLVTDWKNKVISWENNGNVNVKRNQNKFSNPSRQNDFGRKDDSDRLLNMLGNKEPENKDLDRFLENMNKEKADGVVRDTGQAGN